MFRGWFAIYLLGDAGYTPASAPHAAFDGGTFFPLFSVGRCRDHFFCHCSSSGGVLTGLIDAGKTVLEFRYKD